MSALYNPKNPQETATFRFLARVNSLYGLSLLTYHDLYTWSTTHVDKFWSAVWDETGVIGHKGAHIVDNAALPSDNPPWCVYLLHHPTIHFIFFQVL